MSEAEALPAPVAVQKSDKAQIVSALLSISKTTRALMGTKLAEAGFHNGQDELLIALNEEGPVSVSRLADELSVRPSTVSKMLDRLIAKGLVERISDKRDARRTMVRITPAGLDARSTFIVMRDKLENDLIKAFPGDPDDMVQSLDTVANVVRSRLMRLR